MFIDNNNLSFHPFVPHFLGMCGFAPMPFKNFFLVFLYSDELRKKKWEIVATAGKLTA